MKAGSGHATIVAFSALFLLSSAAAAATVQGAIFDEETQNPLARTTVTLTPLPGATAPVVTQLANERGQYFFTNVAPGWYLIRTSRIGYAIGEYGQSRPGLPGVPFQVTGADVANSESHQIVMRRQAAITGTVVDDNSIGIAGWPLNVYTARQPIRRIAQGTADDRGNFRIGELEPGAYIVRSGGGGLEDASTLVPSYYRYGTTVLTSEPVRVRLGETANFVVIHTVEGRLFELSGELTAPDKKNVKLTLITDTGRRIVATSGGPFTATGVPPGLAGLLAEGPGCAGYQQIMVDRNMNVHADCAPISPPVLTGDTDYPLIARRLDLDGPGPESVLSPGLLLTPGPLEFTVRPGPSHYLAAIQVDGDKSPPPPAIEGWFSIVIDNKPRLRVTLSAKPASVSGVVTSASAPIIGAPVFLQLVNPEAPELALQSWTARADAQGNFTFTGLAPGAYRLMSSYDVDFDDPLARSKAVMLTLHEGDAVTQPLEMIRQ
jgi:hypothetical protein